MIRIFKLTSEQKQILKDWSNRQSDSEYFEWFNRQKRDSEKFNEILEKTKFKEGYDLTLEEFHEISDLLTADLGNTALSMRGENSIFEMNDLSIFNARLRNLLFGENKLSERVNSFVNLRGVGIMTVSQFLCLFDHKKYAFFSGYMESVFYKILLIENNQYEDSINQSRKEFSLDDQYLYITHNYFKYFVILREIRAFLNLDSYLQVQNLLWRMYSPADSTEQILDESEGMDSRNWWIEKSYLKTHKRFGTVLASPQKRIDGVARRAYDNMRSVKKGDVIIHLVDNELFIGTSVVEKEYESVPYADYRGKRPGYLVQLKNYEKYEHPIERDEILKNDKYKSILLDLLKKGHYLFYHRKLNLNEGAYLTEAPQELVRILNEIYKEKSGKNLPHFSETGMIESLSGQPIVKDSLILPSEKDVNNAISKIKETLLIDETSIREIVTHLVSGKNVIICGPIGTGKTHLAMLIPKLVWERIGGYYPLLYTATGDWTTHDVIGGIVPKLNEDKEIVYRIHRGCVYEAVTKNLRGEGDNRERCPYFSSEGKYCGVWLVIDEFNRANIDKAFGEMFTAIEYSKLKVPTMKMESPFDEIIIPNDFRIIGTLNTFDKHYLFKLSDALKRRFAFVEILPPSANLAEKEKFYALKRSLKNLDSIINQEKLDRISPSLNDKKQMIEPKDQESSIFITLDVAHKILSFVRLSKNLGTAILMSIYSYILVDRQLNDEDYYRSLDVALRSIVIPHLENIPRWSLESIRAFCCQDIVSFFKNREPTESNFGKYAIEFSKLLQYLGKDDIKGKTELYKNGQVRKEQWPNYDPWKGEIRPHFPLFGQALDSLISELELL